MSSFLSFVLSLGVRFVLSFLLKKLSSGQLIEYVKEAEKKESTKFGKRGYVYRILKRMENTLPEHILNTVVELGVLLYKQKTKK